MPDLTNPETRKRLREKAKGPYRWCVENADLIVAALDLIEQQERSLAVIHEHAIKTRKAANDRRKAVGQDGLTIQLEQDAMLLEMVTREAAGKELAEKLVRLEAKIERLRQVLSDVADNRTWLVNAFPRASKQRKAICDLMDRSDDALDSSEQGINGESQ